MLTHVAVPHPTLFVHAAISIAAIAARHVTAVASSILSIYLSVYLFT